jgi:hypothetical protein
MTAFGWFPNGYVVEGYWQSGWWPAWTGLIIEYLGPVANLISRISMMELFIAALATEDMIASEVVRELLLISWVNEE